MKIKLEDLLLSAFFFMLALATFRPAYDYSLVRLLLTDVFAVGVSAWLLFRRNRFSLPLPILTVLTCLVFWVAVSIGFSTFPAATLREFSHFLTYLLVFLVASQLNLSLFSLTFWFLSVVILCLTGLYDQFQAGIGIVTPLGNKNFFAGYLVLIIPAAASAFWLTLFAWRSRTSKTAGARTGPAKKSGRQKTGLLKLQNAITAAQTKRLPESGGENVPANRSVLEIPHPVLFIPLLIFWGLCFIFFTIMLFAADSQAAQAGAILGLLFLPAAYFGRFVFRRLSLPLRWLTVFILILLVTGAVFIGVRKGIPYVRNNVRFPLWVGSVTVVRQNPFTGCGPGSFLAVFQRFRPSDYYRLEVAAPLSDHSHNEYLELAAESGLPAVAFFLALAALIFFQTLKNPANRENWFLPAGILAGLFGALVDGLFSTNLRTFSVAPLFWCNLGLCVSLTGRLAAGPAGEKKAPAKHAGGETAFVWAALIIFGCLAALSIIREIKGQVYYKQGIAARNEKNWPSAIKNYQQAAKLDPANLQAAYKLAFAYANAGRPNEAVTCYQSILADSPNFAKTYYNLALLYLQQNDRTQAIACLQDSLRYNPYDEESRKMMEMLTAGPVAVRRQQPPEQTR